MISVSYRYSTSLSPEEIVSTADFLYTSVIAFAGKALSFKEKISAVTRFFIEFELGFILGEVFCFIAMVVFYQYEEQLLFFLPRTFLFDSFHGADDHVLLKYEPRTKRGGP